MQCNVITDRFFRIFFGNLSEMYFDIRSDMETHICSDTPSGTLFRMYSGNLCSIAFAILSDVNS